MHSLTVKQYHALEREGMARRDLDGKYYAVVRECGGMVVRQVAIQDETGTH